MIRTDKGSQRETQTNKRRPENSPELLNQVTKSSKKLHTIKDQKYTKSIAVANFQLTGLLPKTGLIRFQARTKRMIDEILYIRKPHHTTPIWFWKI